MIKKLGLLAVALTAVAISVLVVGPAFAAGGQRSFKATFSGSAGITGETTLSITGSGIATRMGHITTVGTIVFTGSDSTCPGGIANVNTETLTDNHGDTLTVTSLDIACPTGPGQFHGAGQWTVTGGTGRFDRATGRGSADGAGDFAAGTFGMTLTGFLTLPNA